MKIDLCYSQIMSYFYVDNWPTLADVTPPVKGLYVQGQASANLLTDCVAVVGSRRLTEYGKQVIEKLVPQLVMAGKTIVSGFMYGTDQYAHHTCVDCGGKTIAVLGWGITYRLTGYEQTLADQIMAGGGVLLSEWENQKPLLWTFPVRNRIVAGLAREVYVIEAAEKSGSLITAELAMKFHRKVWAVPGPVTSKVSAGTNRLIAEGKAVPWLAQQADITGKVLAHDPVLDLLADEPLTANEIARKLNQPVAAVGAQLSLFTVTGELTEREGKYYLQHAD